MAIQVIRPQPGPQEAFLASPADVVVYGGAAYGGKTFALLLEAARFTAEPNFGAVIFRRTSPQITSEGGLWDTASKIYPLLGAEGLVGKLQWRFPSGAKITFAHLQHEKDKFSWQGAQLPLIGLDEATHFTEGQFFYLLSRNRDPSATVRPYIRATCNPDPDSFLAGLIAWWIDQDTGLAIPERSGIIRWFIRHHDAVVWAQTKADLERDYPGSEPLSFTFIPSSYKDNPLGLAADPGYMARLSNLPRVEAERLKNGNWLVRPAAGDYFRASDLPLIEAAEVPAKRIRVRWWDRAASLPSESYPDPDWTAGALLSLDPASGLVTIEHIDRFRGRPGTVQARIRQRAEEDGRETAVGLFRDPGQAGVAEAESYLRLLAGFRTIIQPETSGKEVKAAPLSSYAQGSGPGQGLVRLVRGPWNQAFISEAENFPKVAHDDQVDAAAGAFNWLAAQIGMRQYAYRPIRPEAPMTGTDHLRSHRVEDAARARQPNTGRLGLRGRSGGLL
jgi:predicted phage terminase large subunit-like protein